MPVDCGVGEGGPETCATEADRVDLIGAKAPCNFFHLTLNPAMEEGMLVHTA